MQVLVQKGQTIIVAGGASWVGVPEGTSITMPSDGAIQVVPANEYNLVPVTNPMTSPAHASDPVQVSPTSPVTVQVSPAKV